jgi:hypothetical protein
VRGDLPPAIVAEDAASPSHPNLVFLHLSSPQLILSRTENILPEFYVMVVLAVKVSQPNYSLCSFLNVIINHQLSEI